MHEDVERDAADRYDSRLAEMPLFHKGKRIGGYRILRRIAAGPTGVVYEAERVSAAGGRVAIKLVASDMDARLVAARFEAERGGLDRLSYPTIARLYDVGVTEDNRAYVVTDLVEGEPITAFCDRHELGLQERGALFVETCEAVQHAHDRGVVHRGIRPSNILVAMRAGIPVARLTDFGVDRASARRLTEAALFNDRGEPERTPEYTSPELLGSSRAEVDGRADVYSLGAVLYELLSGSAPFDAAELREAGLEEARRRVCSEMPPPPSGRAGNTAADAPWPREVRDDADNIVLKALSRDPAQRQGSPRELAEDVKKLFRGAAAAPRQSTITFSSRAVYGVALLAVTIALIAFGLAIVATRPAEPTMPAEPFQPRQQVGSQPRATGEVEHTTPPIEDPQPADTRPVDPQPVAVPPIDPPPVDPIAEDPPPAPEQSPDDLVDEYVASGRLAIAEPLLVETLQTRAATLGPDHLDTLRAATRLGDLYIAQGRFGEAETLLADAAQRAERALPPGHVATARALKSYGECLMGLEMLHEAENVLLDAHAVLSAQLGPGHADTVETITMLVDLYERSVAPRSAAAWRARLPAS